MEDYGIPAHKNKLALPHALEVIPFELDVPAEATFVTLLHSTLVFY